MARGSIALLMFSVVLMSWAAVMALPKKGQTIKFNQAEYEYNLRNCLPNEKFSDYKTDEERTCWDLAPPSEIDHSLNHKQETGCICKERYFRNSKGICVLKKDCDTTVKPPGFGYKVQQNKKHDPTRKA